MLSGLSSIYSAAGYVYIIVMSLGFVCTILFLFWNANKLGDFGDYFFVRGLSGCEIIVSKSTSLTRRTCVVFGCTNTDDDCLHHVFQHETVKRVGHNCIHDSDFLFWVCFRFQGKRWTLCLLAVPVLPIHTNYNPHSAASETPKHASVSGQLVSIALLWWG